MKLSFFDSSVKIDEKNYALTVALSQQDPEKAFFILEIPDETPEKRRFDFFHQYEKYPINFNEIPNPMIRKYICHTDADINIKTLVKMCELPPIKFSVTYPISVEKAASLQANLDDVSELSDDCPYRDSKGFVEYHLRQIGINYVADEPDHFASDCDCSCNFMLKVLGTLALTAGATLFTMAVLGALGVISAPVGTTALAMGVTGAVLALAGSYALGFFSKKPQPDEDVFVIEPSCFGNPGKTV